MLGLGAALALPACGFHPLYAEGSPGQGPAVAGELAKVRVAVVRERNGQLIRRALEQRMPAGATTGVYDLRVGLGFGVEIQGYRRDGTPSRVRYTASALWWLYTLTPPVQVLTNGVERAFDAYNLPESQFFAAENSRDAMERRLVEQLADDLVQRLAIWFTNRNAA